MLRTVRGFVLSVVAHVAAFALITNFDFTQSYVAPRSVEASDPAPIFIDLQALKDLKILRALPVVRPPGPGGKPGMAEKPAEVVLQASTAQHPKFTITLKPMKADNNRQAILQKMSAPDLKIQVEQKVPDIVTVEGPTLAKPQIDMALHQPLAHDNKVAATDPAPTVAANAPVLNFKIASTVQQPQMPVAFAASKMGAPHAGDPASGPAGATSAGGSGDQNGGIVVVSIDPGEFSKLASLAQGNRYGMIAIAPVKEGPGSPGGSPGGVAGGGSGGPGRGGDSASSGVGPGHSGGGGGGAEGAPATFSAVGGTGRAGGVDATKMLGTVKPSTIFAVTSAVKLRRAPLVVATGPIGGGGLDVYGALPCGKLYTIFLPMPGKNWVLQYCAHQAEGTPKPDTAAASSSVIRMEVGLVPPTADQQFDFKRLPVAEKDSDKLIVLRGQIDKNGAVSDVRVFQGVLPDMDSSAVAAFSSWKFQPAMRANLPIGVDVLVGIPARIPEKPDAAPAGKSGTQN